jgi:hypothetical protein
MSAKNENEKSEERFVIELFKPEDRQVRLVLSNVYVGDRVKKVSSVTVYVTDAHADKIGYFLGIPIKNTYDFGE